MGDATRGSPVPLQASIIPPLGSNHKPLYVKKLSFTAYPAAFLAPLGATLWLVEPGAPHPPSEEQRPGFSLALPRPDALSPPLLRSLRRAHNTRRYGHPLTGAPGPIGTGRCRTSENPI